MATTMTIEQVFAERSRRTDGFAVIEAQQAAKGRVRVCEGNCGNCRTYGPLFRRDGVFGRLFCVECVDAGMRYVEGR